ncbi:hypothetical protein ABTL37_19760, partial [Acinetobacter baumannii]
RMQAFNAFIRAYCAKNGRVLIDLAPVLEPRGFAEVSTRFSDLIQPRPRMYPLNGAAVAAELAKSLGPGAEASGPPPAARETQTRP